MGVNLEWEVCESGRGAGEEWAAATVPSRAELLLPAQRGLFCAGSTPVGLGGFGRRRGTAGRRDYCIQAVWLDQKPRSRDGC